MVKANLKSAGGSDPGRVRRNNEDAWHIDADRGIFLVVDGIGGQNAGEKAAEIAIERVRARLERQTGATEQRVREAITLANNEILRTASTHPEWEGMACVLTLLVLENGSAVVGHVGDSRLYQIRGRTIRKITHDHSPVGEREDAEELTEAEAMRHPRRNEVFRDVGSEEHQPDDPNFIEIQRVTFDPESAFVLCSDGLSDQVPSAAIRDSVVRNGSAPDRAVRELIAAANAAGGKDNVTVVIVEGEQFQPAPQPQQPSDTPARHSTVSFFTALLAATATVALAIAVVAPKLIKPRIVNVPTPPKILAAGPGQQYATIAAALDAANPGDTVEIAAGEYHEQVRLKDGVTLRSRVPREAVLRAAPLSAGPAVVAEGIKDARLDGFRIQADPQTPLSAGILLNNSAVHIEDTEITGAAVGIEIRGTANPSLVGNAIRECTSEGVLITGASSPWISHNSLQRNKGAGIAARGGSHPSLVGNVFEKNIVELPPDMPLDAVREHNFFLDAPAGARRPAGGRK